MTTSNTTTSSPHSRGGEEYDTSSLEREGRGLTGGCGLFSVIESACVCVCVCVCVQESRVVRMETQ